jgi:hypothetical protein
MVGIVVVSHSRRLADAAVELALQMVRGTPPPIEVAAGRLHQEVVDGLVNPRATLDERVVDRIEGPGDADLETGLLGDLAQGGLLAGFPGVGRSLGKGPGHDVAISPARPDDEVRDITLEPNDDPAGGCGGRVPQPRHGAMAALDRRSVPARPDRAQCMATSGRGRPSVGRPGRAARNARQLPRRRARTLPDGR